MAEHRPIYKITQLLLVLYLSSRGKKSSLIRLHLFSWVLKDDKRKKALLESSSEGRMVFGIWGVDPAVNISLQFAEAEGLVDKAGTSYKLTKVGIKYIEGVGESLAFKGDFDFLKSLGRKITEGMVGKIVKGWE